MKLRAGSGGISGAHQGLNPMGRTARRRPWARTVLGAVGRRHHRVVSPVD
jgi:hypothetical protein